MSEEKKLAIIGFGNQAKAWALNLRDSGWDVVIYLRPQSKSFAQAQKLGFLALPWSDQSISSCHSFALLIPDHEHGEALSHLPMKQLNHARMIYAHGYSLAKYKLKVKYPELTHLLLAPKSIASEMRFFYETGKKLSGVFSVEHSTNPTKDQEWLMSLARALGIKVGPFPAQFSEECKADLFSEQALLCGLYPYAILEAYNQLRKNGVNAELAYLECWHESKLIMDAMVERGPKAFFSLISPNALMGSQKGKKLLSPELKKVFNLLLNDIDDGTFENEMDQFSHQSLKKEVEDFWDQQELQQTYEKLKDLYL
ncbi:MAG: hypothetical protein ACOYL6_01600 [Bacteriovoracaceae bacterium]